MALNIDQIRQQFPILRGSNPPLYLDSAATSQKPDAVLDAMKRFYETENANVHRGMHGLAEAATTAYENARKIVADFVRAKGNEEIIFTKSCTEALNLVAHSWGRATLNKGDTIILSLLEHHSNIVPWLQLKEERGINIEWIDVTDDGELKLEELDEYLKKGNVKLVSVTGLSNVLGVHTPLRTIADKAHAAGALLCIDAAQLVAHTDVNVRELDCDFLAFSGHKVFGPTGIGVLYAKRALLESMPPFLGGGMMIEEVTQEKFTSAPVPQKFEAGTPPVAEAVGLAAAIKWLGQYSWTDIAQHETKLFMTAFEEFSEIPGMHILGPRRFENISGCISFTLNNVHPHDLTDILGQENICMRAGHHCTQPLHKRLRVHASTRLSVSVYNTEDEIRRIVPAILNAQKILETPTSYNLQTTT